MYRSMNIKSLTLAISVLVLSTSFLTACGGGGGGSEESAGTSTALTGQFIDSAVANLNYQSDSYSGTTNAQGEFKYKQGELITFKIGEAYLGQAFGSTFLTPYDLTDENLIAIDPITLGLFLQSLDRDANLENGIELPTENLQALPASIDFSNRANIEQLITDLSLVPLNIDNVETNLINGVSEATSASLAPGKFKNTINYSFVRNTDYPSLEGGIYTGNLHNYYLDRCQVGFTSAEIEVLESSIAGTIIGIDGIVHTFDVPKALYKDHVTDTGVIINFTGSSEYLGLKLHEPSSDCYTALQFDRVNGELIPPEVRWGLVDTISPVPGTLPVGFTFRMRDKDGWITRATLTWSQVGGESGVIDLLTEKADLLEHWMYDYIASIDISKLNLNGGLFTRDVIAQENFYGFGVFEEKYNIALGGYSVTGYENQGFNQSNPSRLHGVGLMIGIEGVEVEYECENGVVIYLCPPIYTLIGDVLLEIKVTDNDGKSFSDSLLIKADPNVDNGIADFYTVQENNFSINPPTEICSNIRMDSFAANALNAETIVNPDLTGGGLFVSGNCPEALVTNSVCTIASTDTILLQTVYMPTNTVNPKEACVNQLGGTYSGLDTGSNPSSEEISSYFVKDVTYFENLVGNALCIEVLTTSAGIDGINAERISNLSVTPVQLFDLGQCPVDSTSNTVCDWTVPNVIGTSYLPDSTLDPEAVCRDEVGGVLR